MGLQTTKLTPLPIGVDLGTSAVKMVQLRAGNAQFELLAAGSADVPTAAQDDPAARLDSQGRQIREILKSGPFKGRHAILAMPASATFLQPLKVPAGTPTGADDAVTAELEGKLPYPVRDAVVRQIVAGSAYGAGENMEERIVVAVSRGDLERHLAMVRRAGLDVVGVNIEACAVAECFSRLFRRSHDENRVTLFVDIGAGSMQVAVMQGPRLAFARNLPVGGRTLDAEVAKAMKIPVDQAAHIRRHMAEQPDGTPAKEDLFRLLDGQIARISGQITDSLRYCESSFRNWAIEGMIFLGGQAHDTRLCQAIAQRLNLAAQVGDPMVGIRRSSAPGESGPIDAKKPQPAWTVAIGLSMGANAAA